MDAVVRTVGIIMGGREVGMIWTRILFRGVPLGRRIWNAFWVIRERGSTSFCMLCG